MVEVYNSIIALVVFGVFGWGIITVINNQNQFKQERKEFLKVLEIASLEELKKMYGNFYREKGSENERKFLLERMEQLKNEEKR